MGHIQLSREADLVVVAPATADLLAKMVGGIADDLATTLLLATDKPVLAAPAMNVRMWLHPATQRNVATLRGDRGDGDGARTRAKWRAANMAHGRLPRARSDQGGDRGGAGARHDCPAARRPARFRAVAPPPALWPPHPRHRGSDPRTDRPPSATSPTGRAASRASRSPPPPPKRARRCCWSRGRYLLPTPPGVVRVDVETRARNGRPRSRRDLPVDAAIMVAAVADWRAADTSAQKIKKDGSGEVPPLALAENPDILAKRREERQAAAAARRLRRRNQRRDRPCPGKARPQGLRPDRRQRCLGGPDGRRDEPRSYRSARLASTVGTGCPRKPSPAN